ncbi:sugar transferase [Mariniblastus sp.]|nr:sugar transferase [Mariniblastus sp.]
MFDFFGSIFLLIALLPILLMAMLVVRLKMGSPVFFRQQRPGKDGKPFEMIKLRSMLGTLDSKGEPLPDAERLTRLGKFLRSTSIDELPSLWNVIMGQMSLVGPRPLLVEYLDIYSQRQRRRHDVRPGITGWAQVNGRNAVSWDDKLEMDVWYVENPSFWLDIKILLLTILKVVRRDGISAPGHATQEKFTGSP